ncbi:preprotein translocase subunit SecG [candidate division WWE3 bacterium CG06_land_8_20_14_3_00_42_16]|uniref:Protein-export membrane protein SecG n=3 Tax=Katanobacteria TaxID=422282 RepID=A0A2M7ANL4_UNCKA|nr:MAG: preprotein translocase subunit SecG [bacterium CG1_02_42_9]PIU68978.1 MAG: preprotein translocase subunit SecG [candidate division WWE3 bacterium CG06_land_8_20_14_3_00_42_16]PJC68102.1 MAG: preprotein translocase subunit SecG [candidate division WWE3 bacterium CG_4_8_14_3_um_filter_42_11]
MIYQISVYGQIVIAILLIILILLQARGTGLSVTFGGQGDVWRSRRGIEKTIFIGTIILSILFLATTIALLFLSRSISG